MLLGTLGPGLLGKLLTGKGAITADEGTIRAGEKYKYIMEIDLNLMVFMQEIIYLK